MACYYYIIVTSAYWGWNNENFIDKSKMSDSFIFSIECQPVRGCDGLIYGNDCSAEKAGVTEWTEGGCK